MANQTPFQNCWECGSDFYEMGSGSLFHIADYKKAMEEGQNPDKMMVSDGFGNIIGYLPKDAVENLIK